MKKVCPKCGGEKFAARQTTYHDVIVDSDNMFLKDDGTYGSETPYGPYTCVGCDTEFNELTELKEVKE